MRKMSQDGGDTTSITSVTENENKKYGTGIIKTTRNSIKRKVQNFHHESDDTVIEPLLQKDKEKTVGENQSAKYILPKPKTDSMCEKETDKEKLLSDDKIGMPIITNVLGITTEQTSICNDMNNTLNDNLKSQSSLTMTLHNHMNTNVFSKHDSVKPSAKNQILVEVTETKQISYNPSSLIFTTAKIHMDSKAKHLEPVQVTPVPIVSIIEGGVVKAGVVDYEKNPSILTRLDKDNFSAKIKHAKNELKTKEEENLKSSLSAMKDNDSSKTITSPKVKEELKHEHLNKISPPQSTNATLLVLDKTNTDPIKAGKSEILIETSMAQISSIPITNSGATITCGISNNEASQNNLKNMDLSKISFQKGAELDNQLSKSTSNPISAKQLQRQQNMTLEDIETENKIKTKDDVTLHQPKTFTDNSDQSMTEKLINSSPHAISKYTDDKISVPTSTISTIPKSEVKKISPLSTELVTTTKAIPTSVTVMKSINTTNKPSNNIAETTSLTSKPNLTNPERFEEPNATYTTTSSTSTKSTLPSVTVSIKSSTVPSITPPVNPTVAKFTPTSATSSPSAKSSSSKSYNSTSSISPSVTASVKSSTVPSITPSVKPTGAKFTLASTTTSPSAISSSSKPCTSTSSTSSAVTVSEKLPSVPSITSVAKPIGANFIPTSATSSTVTKSSSSKSDTNVIPSVNPTAIKSEAKPLCETTASSTSTKPISTGIGFSMTMSIVPKTSATQSTPISKFLATSQKSVVSTLSSDSQMSVKTATTAKPSITSPLQPVITSKVSHMSTNMSKSVSSSNGKSASPSSTTATIKSATSNT